MTTINRGYSVKYTDNTIPEIKIPRRVFVEDILDINLIGKRTLEYGEELNENTLHLLEHFSCPSINDQEDVPDPDFKLSSVLNNPTLGQLWYNNTGKYLCQWNGYQWVKFVRYGDISGNSGFLFDGEHIPIPKNRYGEPADISNCNIHVNPAWFMDRINKYECFVDSDGKLDCKYLPQNASQWKSTFATYIVLCDSINSIPPVITPTPTPTVPPFVPASWDYLWTGNGGSILNGIIFYSNSSIQNPTTRTNKAIGNLSYFSCLINNNGTGRTYVGIGNETIDTTVNNCRIGLSNGGVEIDSNGSIISAATSIHSISNSNPIALEFAVYNNMVWIRANGGTWLGGGNPETYTNPTVHLIGTKLYFIASVSDISSSVVFHNTAALTTGDVPENYIPAYFVE